MGTSHAFQVILPFQLPIQIYFDHKVVVFY